MTWLDFIIDHYTERLSQETRPQARSFIRQTLTNLKNDSSINNSDRSNNGDAFLVSRVTDQQAKKESKWCEL